MTVGVTTMGAASRALATAVRMEMAREGVNQSALARRLGTYQAWVSRRVSVTADVPMTGDDLERIADALDVPMQRFLASDIADEVGRVGLEPTLGGVWVTQRDYATAA